MKTQQLHIIEKETIEIVFPGFEATRNWEDNDRSSFVDIVRNTIETLFSEYEIGNKHLIIEKLEVDLGSFQQADISRELSERLYTELKKQLDPYVSASHSTIEGTPQQTNGHSDRDDKQDHRLLTSTRLRLESLLFFLKSGRLPWWAHDNYEWDEQWLQQLDPSGWLLIKDFFVSNNNDAVLRLITHVNDQFLGELVRGLSGNSKATEAWRWLLEVIKSINKLLSDGKIIFNEQTGPPEAGSLRTRFSSMNLLRQLFWSRWILHITQKSSTPGIRFLLEKDKKIITAIRLLIKNRNIKGDSPISIDKVPEIWEDELNNYDPEEDRSGQSMLKDEAITDPENFLETKLLPKGQKTAERKIDTGEPVKNVYISGAGIVLLHPFFPQLLRHLNLLRENDFVNASSQTRAVYLLHYLCTGESEAPEYKLLLPKLLCGLAWKQPLEAIEPLNETELALCDELLVEVIKHWTVLRNSSPAGLREAFLQRNGRIEIRSDGWQLIVEAKAQDVLIGRLPWGISIIKYPWMTGMLSVVWT